MSESSKNLGIRRSKRGLEKSFFASNSVDKAGSIELVSIQTRLFREDKKPHMIWHNYFSASSPANV